MDGLPKYGVPNHCEAREEVAPRQLLYTDARSLVTTAVNYKVAALGGTCTRLMNAQTDRWIFFKSFCNNCRDPEILKLVTPRLLLLPSVDSLLFHEEAIYFLQRRAYRWIYICLGKQNWITSFSLLGELLKKLIQTKNRRDCLSRALSGGIY